MKTINGLINEKRYAEELINNKYLINERPVSKCIMCYIKYLKNYPDPDTGNMLYKKQIRQKIDDLMYNYYKGFVMADWDKKIQSWLNKYTKEKYCKLKVPQPVNITFKELNKIKVLDNIIEEKVLFMLLFLSKVNRNDLGNDNLWIYEDNKVVFKLAQYKYIRGVDRDLQRNKLLHLFKDKGYIDTHCSCDSNGKIMKFGETKIGEGLNIEASMDNIDQVVYEYLVWRGEPYKKCSRCDKYFRYNPKVSNPAKYCRPCAKTVKLEQTNACKRAKEESEKF